MEPKDTSLTGKKATIRWGGALAQRALVFSRRALKGKPLVLVAVTVGLSAVLVCAEIKRVFARPPLSIRQARFLVARRDLPTGQPFYFLDYTLSQRTDSNPVLSRNAVTDQDLHLLKGATLNRPITEGTILTLDALLLSHRGPRLGLSIPKGQRAFSIRPINRLPTHSGDRVDIFLVTGDDAPLTLLEGALVLDSQMSPEDWELTLAVGHGEITLLEKARQKGKLTVALRNPEDVVASGAERPNRRLFRRNHKKRVIEIWSEAR